MEVHKSKSSVAVWVLGIAGLLLFWWAVTKIDSRLERTRFSDGSPSPQSAVVALSGDKFAVVDQGTANIRIYRIDGKGKVIQLDNVSTNFGKVEPRKE